MASPHRFWRFQQSASQGGAYVQLSEVSFRGSALQDLSAGGSAFASSEYSGSYTAGRAFDKSASTSWCTVSGQFPGWIAYDHGAPVEVVAVQVTWDTNSGYLPTSVADLSLAWSDDGVIWSAPIVLALMSGALSSGATAVFVAQVAKPLIVVNTPKPLHVLCGAYTGPYGHVVSAPAVTASGDYKTGLLGKGTGTVYGTTEVKGTPNAPLRARVRLIREKDGLLYRETWSDPLTGAYRFDNVDELETYTVLTYHPTRDKRAVIADNLTPEAM